MSIDQNKVFRVSFRDGVIYDPELESYTLPESEAMPNFLRQLYVQLLDTTPPLPDSSYHIPGSFDAAKFSYTTRSQQRAIGFWDSAMCYGKLVGVAGQPNNEYEGQFHWVSPMLAKALFKSEVPEVHLDATNVQDTAGQLVAHGEGVLKKGADEQKAMFFFGLGPFENYKKCADGTLVCPLSPEDVEKLDLKGYAGGFTALLVNCNGKTNESIIAAIKPEDYEQELPKMPILAEKGFHKLSHAGGIVTHDIGRLQGGQLVSVRIGNYTAI